MDLLDLAANWIGSGGKRLLSRTYMACRSTEGSVLRCTFLGEDMAGTVDVVVLLTQLQNHCDAYPLPDG